MKNQKFLKIENSIIDVNSIVFINVEMRTGNIEIYLSSDKTVNIEIMDKQNCIEKINKIVNLIQENNTDIFSIENRIDSMLVTKNVHNIYLINANYLDYISKIEDSYNLEIGFFGTHNISINRWIELKYEDLSKSKEALDMFINLLYKNKQTKSETAMLDVLMKNK